MTIQIVPTGGAAATADSLSISQTDLAAFGLTAAEMTVNDNGFYRAIFALLKAFQAENLTGKLGIAHPATPQETRAGTGLTNRVYTANFEYYNKFGQNSLLPIPLPTSGTQNGLGGIAIADIFANATKVAATTNVANPAVLIPTADLLPYGSPSHGSLNPAGGQDNRAWFSALYAYLADNIPLRTASVASAVIARTRTVSNLSIPANYTQTTNPVSGISSSDLPLITANTISYAITIQTIDSNSSDTFDVNVVTS